MTHQLDKLAVQLAAKGALPALAWLGSVQNVAQQLQHVQHRYSLSPGQRPYAAAAGNGACELGGTSLGRLVGPQLVPSSGRRSASSSGAHLQSVHSAAIADNASDDESRQEPPAFNAQLFPPQYGFAAQQGQQQPHHQHHHAGLSSSTRSKQHSPGHSPQHHHHPTPHHHQPHRQSGELHAAHGRRHATSSSTPGETDVLSDLVLACKGLGVLRRIMLKYKANMGPEQVANTLLCLQHLTLEGRRLRGASPASQRGGSSSSSQHHADEELAQAAAQRRGASVARAQPRVRAAQEFSRATARAAESDGPQEQLVAQMLGELGNMIWHMMGDMSGADLSKLLYSWARLDWHPEQKLLADVATSFLAAASAEATAANSSASDASAHWLAAGLWGLARLGEPFNGPVLTLLQQQWRALLPFWSKQQVADVAWALVAAADESTAAEALEQQQQPVDAEQLSPMVLGLAERLADRLLHQQQQGARQAHVLWSVAVLRFSASAE
ncbi:hypothetical protein OEZ86_002836 [Tetradesmus obliquus]|nr:hypothetical protein OEZ86_002836 [Tetradesmus obliquus]